MGIRAAVVQGFSLILFNVLALHAFIETPGKGTQIAHFLT